MALHALCSLNAGSLMVMAAHKCSWKPALPCAVLVLILVAQCGAQVTRIEEVNGAANLAVQGGTAAAPQAAAAPEVAAAPQAAAPQAAAPQAAAPQAAAPQGGAAGGPAAGTADGANEDGDGGYKRWPPVTVVDAAGSTNFGWVVTQGDAVETGTVNERGCLMVAARTAQGQPFDKADDRRAFFVGTLFVRNFRLAAEIRYVPERSMHEVCFTPPTWGLYSLELRLGFDNTGVLDSTRDPMNNAGFTGYPLIMLAHVHVTSPQGQDFSLTAYRATLPLCTPEILAADKNRGFWVIDTWLPLSCRLTRLEPSDMMKCLNGKNVLMMGDSETRYLFGLMQVYMSYPSRDAFKGFERTHWFERGALLDKLGVPTAVSAVGPPLELATMSAIQTSWEFLGANTTFFGGIYEGFSRRHVLYQMDELVDFNLTYSTYFTISKPPFADWKLSGKYTNGVVVTDGQPYDNVFVANQLHDVEYFDTAEGYADSLTNFAIPGVKSLLKGPESFFMYGGLSSIEARKPHSLHLSGNPRIVAFEDAGYQATSGAGLPNFLLVRPITSCRMDLAYDSTHYRLPVNLAMLDLWLGSYCPAELNAM